MQKKLIALAVAGLVAAPAFAQSNVTIYGRVDYGFMSRSGSSGDVLDDINGKTEFASGIQGGSRIGFKGAEDLGNGLKAIFEIEYGLSMDQGTTSSTTWGNRHSYVGLTGNFGTVVGGRLDGVRYNVFGKYDPFGLGTVGNFTQLTPQVDRADNAVAYISPSFSGLTVTLAYSSNIAGTEGASNNLTGHFNGGNDLDFRLQTIMLSYDNGPLSLTADYEQIKTMGVEDNKLWVGTFGASYDFGVVKVSALYDIVKSDDNGLLGDYDQKSWLVGLKAPIGGAVDARAMVGRTKIDGIGGSDDLKATKWAIGADYKLSKRTNVYADYGSIHNKEDGFFQITPSAATGPFGGYGTRGFDVGIAHKF
jgi:predicted porin